MILVRDITELRGPEIDDQLTEEQIKLWVEIRKRMPGIRVGMVENDPRKYLFYADELAARGSFGFGSKNFRNASTFYIEGPLIRNERGGSGMEHRRLRSGNAATLARKAKTNLRAWTVRDRATHYSFATSRLQTARTPQEDETAKARDNARRLLNGVGYISPTPSFLSALRHVVIPDQNIQHAVRVLIAAMDEEKEKNGTAAQPVYVAVHERRGVPVYDLYNYANNEILADAAPQDAMPASLYERLATLNIADVEDVVPHIGVKVSAFEFVLYPPKEEA